MATTSSSTAWPLEISSETRAKVLHTVLQARLRSKLERPSAPLGASARIERADGQSVELGADEETGCFPTVVVEGGSTNRIEVRYAQADPEYPPEISVHVEDGGYLGNGQWVQAVPLEGNRAQFEFVTSDQSGHHRLTLRRGADTKVLDLWVEGHTEDEQ